MGRTIIADVPIFVENTVSLSAVTTATDGSSIDTRWYDKIAVWVSVPVNTGAVTVNIEASPSGLFAGEEETIQTKTYAAVGSDVFQLIYYYPYLRVTTTTQSNSTVTVTVTGRS